MNFPVLSIKPTFPSFSAGASPSQNLGNSGWFWSPLVIIRGMEIFPAGLIKAYFVSVSKDCNSTRARPLEKSQSSRNWAGITFLPVRIQSPATGFPEPGPAFGKGVEALESGDNDYLAGFVDEAVFLPLSPRPGLGEGHDAIKTQSGGNDPSAAGVDEPPIVSLLSGDRFQTKVRHRKEESRFPVLSINLLFPSLSKKTAARPSAKSSADLKEAEITRFPVLSIKP